MVYLIFKGSGWAGKSSSSSLRTKSQEQILKEKLEKGQLLDRDIQDICDSGDRGLKESLENEANRKYQQKKDLERKYGKDVDGINRKGELYKDMKLNSKDFGL